VPAGYYRFTDPTGFSIGVPAGWRVSHAGHYVYVRDPANGGVFLIIDQSGQPKPDPLADWRQQAAARQSSYPDYHLVTLRAVPYPQAEKAADWEFTYKRNGVIIQVLNRNILANAHHAYALYWTTPASQWSAYYHYFQVFAATFKPARPLQKAHRVRRASALPACCLPAVTQRSWLYTMPPPLLPAGGTVVTGRFRLVFRAWPGVTGWTASG